MRNKTMGRAMLLMASVLLVAGSGCNLGIGDFLADLFGIGTTATGKLYFSVYNFSDNAVKAEVTYRDQSGVEHVQAITQNGTSPIPAGSRGTLEIDEAGITTQADSPLVVTFTFTVPGQDDVVVVIDLLRGDIATDQRARFGVLGMDAESIGLIID